MLFSLLVLVGAVAGWLLGVLIVPYDEREARTFSVFIKVISGFITGYLLSKVDPLLASLLAIDPTTGVAPISQELVAKRVLITFASFGISLLTVFRARAYWSTRQEAQTTDGPGAASGGVAHTKD
jgi:multisubunit Na+/H+ antiporter MnhC subunit